MVKICITNGNMIEGFNKLLTYDGWNRLVEINDSTTRKLLATYFYDHEGKRIKKTVFNVSGTNHNESTYCMNSRPADFIQVINTNGTIINETYIYLQDKLIAKFDTNGRKFFYHPDHLGSTSLVTNESGDVVEDLLYLPYGCILSGTEISRFGYTGQENDKESGFIDYGARQYDPRFKRFLQCDPVKSNIYDPQNLNCYSYVLNNPYKYTDPTGNIIDTVVDVGFIAYDIYTIIQDPSNSANYIALAADAGGAILPGVTGLGIAVRTAKTADKALDLATTADKISDGVKGVNQLENAKDAERVAQSVPNPYGAKGGPAHQAGVNDAMKDLESRGLTPKTEVTIKDPITGEARRADAVGIQDNQITEIHQIGKENKGGSPVSRERSALSDISNSIDRGGSGKKGGVVYEFGQKVKSFFHSYNKRGKN